MYFCTAIAAINEFEATPLSSALIGDSTVSLRFSLH